MIVLAKDGEKVIIMRDDPIRPFIVAKTGAPKAKVGSVIESYRGGENGYFRTIEGALLAYHGINYNWDSVQCVMDNVDLLDYHIFECAKCGETKDYDEMCLVHNDITDKICKDCCDNCRSERAYLDEVDRKIDEQKLNS